MEPTQHHAKKKKGERDTRKGTQTGVNRGARGCAAHMNENMDSDLEMGTKTNRKMDMDVNASVDVDVQADVHVDELNLYKATIKNMCRLECHGEADMGTGAACSFCLCWF